MALLILVILLAIAGGFLGDLLELAAWLVVALAVVGAIFGFLVYRVFERFKSKVT